MAVGLGGGETGSYCQWVTSAIGDVKKLRRFTSNVSFKTSISLLIFCFDDLSIVMSGVLKSPTIIVLLSVSPFCLLVFVLSIEALLC